jgi:hypothetical protein
MMKRVYSEPVFRKFSKAEAEAVVLDAAMPPKTFSESNN